MLFHLIFHKSLWDRYHYHFCFRVHEGYISCLVAEKPMSAQLWCHSDIMLWYPHPHLPSGTIYRIKLLLHSHKNAFNLFRGRVCLCGLSLALAKYSQFLPHFFMKFLDGKASLIERCFKCICTHIYLNMLFICISSCLVAQLCLILYDPMDCSPSGSSVHGISQARILEWVTIS